MQPACTYTGGFSSLAIESLTRWGWLLSSYGPRRNTHKISLPLAHVNVQCECAPGFTGALVVTIPRRVFKLHPLFSSGRRRFSSSLPPLTGRICFWTRASPRASVAVWRRRRHDLRIHCRTSAEYRGLCTARPEFDLASLHSGVTHASSEPSADTSFASEPTVHRHFGATGPTYPAGIRGAGVVMGLLRSRGEFQPRRRGLGHEIEGREMWLLEHDASPISPNAEDPSANTNQLARNQAAAPAYEIYLERYGLPGDDFDDCSGAERELKRSLSQTRLESSQKACTVPTSLSTVN